MPDNASKLEVLDRVFESARQGAVVLTSNQRAARFLQQRFARSMQAEGRTGWPTPQILTWDAWLSEIWRDLSWQDAMHRGSPPPLLLSSEQEHLLWVRVIASSAQSTGFSNASPLNEDALADLAQQAWALLHEYGQGVASLRSHSVPRVDWQRYRAWCLQFAESQQKSGWMTRSELPSVLMKRLQSQLWTPPAHLIAWSFDRFTPAQRRLLEALEEHSRVEQVSITAGDEIDSAASLQTTSQEDEFHAAAAWASARLQQNPHAQIAILTTKAAEDRGALSRALSLRFRPQVYSFSLGHPLQHFPLVRIALLLLRWTNQPLAPADISDLLLAPELTRSEEERRERAVFDAEHFRQRSIPDPAMRLGAFAAWLGQALRQGREDSLNRLLSQCMTARDLVPDRLTLAAEDWAGRFRAILAAFDFPTLSGASSQQYQTTQRWEQLLDEFASLGLHGDRMPFSAAMRQLERMASQTIFQPETTSAPVQIIGPLESAGSLFDGIFFTGCTEDRWPLPAAIHPLLPIDLQQKYGMPGAVRGKTLKHARQMTERMLHAAPEVIFSYPTRNSDGEARPSAALKSPQISPASEKLLAEVCVAAPISDWQLEAYAEPPTAPWDSSRGRVPSSALKSQAACPFQAFALRRLRARGEELPEEGLDGMQRGKFLHSLLQHVWTDADGLKDSTGLQAAIESNSLETLVQAKAAQVIKESNSESARDGWQREFLRLEQARLSDIVCRWLRDVESLRAPFVVKETEAEKEFSIDGLQFRVRVDRTDELTNGNLVLLDYKSGKIEMKDWNPPRMDDPQLPLYGLYALTDIPAAVAFGSMVSGKKPCMRGVANRDGILPLGKKDCTSADELQTRLEEWQEDIQDLAYEFANGEARVNPKRGADTCKNCQLQSLCRVNEQDGLLDDDSEDDASNGASND